MTNLLIYLKTKQGITPHYKTQGLPVPSNGQFKNQKYEQNTKTNFTVSFSVGDASATG